jgi:hypothetical protein
MALSKEAREYFRKEGAIGGRIRARNTTPQRRKEIARKAAQARWSKEKKKAEK